MSCKAVLHERNLEFYDREDVDLFKHLELMIYGMKTSLNNKNQKLDNFEMSLTSFMDKVPMKRIKLKWESGNIGESN